MKRKPHRERPVVINRAITLAAIDNCRYYYAQPPTKSNLIHFHPLGRILRSTRTGRTREKKRKNSKRNKKERNNERNTGKSGRNIPPHTIRPMHSIYYALHTEFINMHIQ